MRRRYEVENRQDWDLSAASESGNHRRIAGRLCFTSLRVLLLAQWRAVSPHGWMARRCGGKCSNNGALVGIPRRDVLCVYNAFFRFPYSLPYSKYPLNHHFGKSRRYHHHAREDRKKKERDRLAQGLTLCHNHTTSPADPCPTCVHNESPRQTNDPYPPQGAFSTLMSCAHTSPRPTTTPSSRAAPRR